MSYSGLSLLQRVVDAGPLRGHLRANRRDDRDGCHDDQAEHQGVFDDLAAALVAPDALECFRQSSHADSSKSGGNNEPGVASGATAGPRVSMGAVPVACCAVTFRCKAPRGPLP